MTGKKSERNKTISASLAELEGYSARVIDASFLKADNTVTDKTVNGDMLEICALLPHKSFDLVIADPPYNLRKKFGDTVFTRKTAEAYEDYTRKWLCAVKPLIKDNGSIYVCCDWESSLIIGRVLGEFFCVRNRITWQREKGRGAKSNWKNGCEDIWFATVSDNYTFNLDAVKLRKKVLAPYRENGKPKDWQAEHDGNFRDTCPSNFWDDITVPFWSMPENTAHPTQKPEKLIAKLVLASSNTGDTVLDPFSGSGTTCVTAKKLGRHYLGIELDPQYCAWTELRLEIADNDKRIQGYEDGFFKDRNM